MSIKIYSEDEEKEFRIKYPQPAGMNNLQWVELYNPRTDKDTTLSWVSRVLESEEWAFMVRQFPPTLADFNTRSDGTPDVKWRDGGQSIWVGGTAARDKCDEVGRIVSRSLNWKMEPRRAEKRSRGQRYENPGGGELPNRYGAAYMQANMLYLLLRHLGIETQFDSRYAADSWYYTNPVYPTHAGQLFGAQLMPETDAMPYALRLRVQESLRLQQMFQANQISASAFIKGALRRVYPMRMIWHLLPSAHCESEYFEIRCHKVDSPPRTAQLQAIDHQRYKHTAQAWERYAAAVVFDIDSTGTAFQGWISPEQVLSYTIDKRKESGKDVGFFKIPRSELQPMSSLLSCLQGFNLEKLLAEKRIFIK